MSHVISQCLNRSFSLGSSLCFNLLPTETSYFPLVFTLKINGSNKLQEMCKILEASSIIFFFRASVYFFNLFLPFVSYFVIIWSDRHMIVFFLSLKEADRLYHFSSKLIFLDLTKTTY